MKDYPNCKDCQCSNCEYNSNDTCNACTECEKGNNQLWDYSCGTHIPHKQAD